MKKLFCAALTLFIVTAAFAQNAALSKISAAQEKITGFESAFTQTRRNNVSGAKTVLQGNMFYSKPECLAMEYSNPDADLMIINGDSHYSRASKVVQVFDASKNAPVKMLKNTLLGCLCGDPAKVAQEVDAKMTVSETSSAYVVVLTANKQAVRGYSKIILNYRKSDCLLMKMIMEEFSGFATEYALNAPKPNAVVDAAHFVAPKK